MSSRPFLVDTSVWIFALRKDFVPPIKERIGELLKDHVVLINGMIKLEILGGVKTKKEFERLKTRLDSLYEVAINSMVWQIAYKIAFELRRKGITVPYTDILIAACALKSRADLIHADRHFDLMAPHIRLDVESYVQEAKG